MTPEEAYEEALRRIREAEKTGATEMKDGKVTGLETLTRLPLDLERLTSLQSLNLSGCRQLTGDLSPLAGLTSLQSLTLPDAISPAGIFPHWQASPRSNGLTCLTVAAFAGLPRSNSCYLAISSGSAKSTSLVVIESRWLI
jgi:hypothetical protein